MVTILLLAAIATMAAVMVVQRIGLGSRTSPDPDPPTYTDGWEHFKDVGIHIGLRDAPIQLVEFVDLECPACRVFHGTVRKLQERYGDALAVTYIHFPLAYHYNAKAAARAADCAHQQRRAQPFIHAVFEDQGPLKTGSWAAYGRAARIPDTVGFTKCVAGTGPVPMIDAGLDLGDEIGISGTPTILLNGWRFSGALPTEKYLARFIDDLQRGRLPEITAGRVDSRVVPLDAPGTGAAARHLVHDEKNVSRIPALRLERTPEWTIDGASMADIDLSRVRFVAVAPDRDVVVGLYGPAAVIRFDRGTGEHRTVAAFGAGPGLVRDVAGLWFARGDSLVVVDPINNRVTWFGQTGTIVRSLSLLRAGGSTRLDPRPSKVLGSLPDGTMVYTTGGSVPGAGGDEPWRSSASVVALPAVGEPKVIATLPDLDLQLMEVNLRGLRMRRPAVLRFSRQAVAAVWGDRIATGSGDSYELDVRAADGSVTSTIEVQLQRARIPEAAFEADLARELAMYATRSSEPGANRDALMKAAPRRPRAESYPAYSQLFATSTILWVVSQTSAGQGNWVAVGFQPNGTIIGRFAGRGKRLPLLITDEQVVIAEEDLDGIVSLQVFRIMGIPEASSTSQSN